jgi:glycosyltransferase involved in cell wall biosynthesis
MRIYLNARFLTQFVTGVQRYAVELVKAFDRLIDRGEADPDRFSFVLIAPNDIKIDLHLKHIPIRKVGRLHGHPWEQIELPAYTRDGLLVSLCNTAPLRARSQVVTIHDAAVFAFPHTYPLAFRCWYRLLLKRLGRTAERIITDSEFSKSELVRHCGVNERRIRAFYLGADHILGVDPDESVLEKHGLLEKPFVLAVSSIAANKNFEAVVCAAQLLGVTDFDVVIAGGVNPRVFSTPDVPLPVGVKYIGYVSDGELRALYEHAACFVFPSLYEGFGLPPLEAMACGAPVITSNISSLPEVVGDAGILINPYNIEELAEAIRRVLGDAKLRQQMRQEGLERAALFTWENTARQTLKVYEEDFDG